MAVTGKEVVSTEDLKMAIDLSTGLIIEKLATGGSGKNSVNLSESGMNYDALLVKWDGGNVMYSQLSMIIPGVANTCNQNQSDFVAVTYDKKTNTVKTNLDDGNVYIVFGIKAKGA